MSDPVDHGAHSEVAAGVRLALMAGLIDGDVAGTEEIVMSMHAAGMGAGRIVNEFLRPVQAQLGERWRTGDMTVVDEHISSASLGTVLELLSRAAPVDHALPAIAVACSERDEHGLAARFVHTEVRAAGYPSQFLGARVPAEDLEIWLLTNEIDLLMLSCSVCTALPGLRRSIIAAHTARVPVMVGGRGLTASPDLARRLGADMAEGTVPDALLQATSLVDIDAAEAAADADLEAADVVTRHRLRIVVAALDRLEPLADTDRARVEDCAAQLVDVAAAVALVSEPQLWADELAWWRDPSGNLRLGRGAGLVGSAVLSAIADLGMEELAATLRSGERPVSRPVSNGEGRGEVAR